MRSSPHATKIKINPWSWIIIFEGDKGYLGNRLKSKSMSRGKIVMCVHVCVYVYFQHDLRKIIICFLNVLMKCGK